MTRVVHFLLHVPKCAGTTVEDHFRTHLGTDFLIAPRWENPIRNVIGNRYPGLTPQALDDVRVVSGHSLSTGLRSLLPGTEIRESVLLRDPLGYLLSFYNYRWTRFDEGWGPKPPEFAKWYGAQRRNPISRFILNRYFEYGVPSIYRLSSAARLAIIEQHFARFHFVGSYRQASDMIAGISGELGIPATVDSRNVTRKPRLGRDDLPGEMQTRIARDNALDQLLYERWSSRGWQGAPTPAKAMPRLDHGRYLWGDLTSVVRRKFTG